MKRNGLTEDQFIMMCALWQDSSLTSVKEVTARVNENHHFKWKNPFTAMILGQLVRHEYLEMTRCENGFKIVPVLTYQQYAIERSLYYADNDNIYEAAFMHVKIYTEEEMQRIRNLIEELE